MAFGLHYEGHKRFVVTNSLVKVKRSDDYFRIFDAVSTYNDETYSNNYDANELEVQFINKMHHQFNEVLPVLKSLYFPNKNRFHSLFPVINQLPPSTYNDEPTTFYLSEPIGFNSKSTRSSTNTTITSHPLLPVYMSASDKGCLSVWSYSPSKTRSLFDYYLDKAAKENNSKQRNVKKIEFNPYGDQFLAVDDETSSTFVFEFEHYLNRNLPHFVIGGSAREGGSYSSSNKSNGSRLMKDCCFMNSSGLLASTNSDYNSRYSNIWDCLLPPSCCNVAEAYGIGGNIVSSMANQKYFLIGNSSTGYVNFIDVRKMQSSFSFQAHNEEVKSMILSSSQNYLATAGKDGIVKIWDISSKTEAALVDSIVPFVKEKNSKKLSLLMRNDCLFVSGASSV
eukprot:CAMPEP_0170537354 /NCGR_PEP_ID=MMETSP0209-20121228/102665_1 /TAXON_ID=665100 ORGANISM="Litonotus pictus, Strain P1" /NCGR_SAMPLE_ID=MMETSP0209 /ASSEMBLY_ACC=CAM_ASM_000301 /LENGTH=393 /DNA_ID=CAMNT_0010838837 /DNA_START=978 /DNA_END=2156 /DNA_ORIENTATION=-